MKPNFSFHVTSNHISSRYTTWFDHNGAFRSLVTHNWAVTIDLKLLSSPAGPCIDFCQMLFGYFTPTYLVQWFLAFDDFGTPLPTLSLDSKILNHMWMLSYPVYKKRFWGRYVSQQKSNIGQYRKPRTLLGMHIQNRRNFLTEVYLAWLYIPTVSLDLCYLSMLRRLQVRCFRKKANIPFSHDSRSWVVLIRIICKGPYFTVVLDLLKWIACGLMEKKLSNQFLFWHSH